MNDDNIPCPVNSGNWSYMQFLFDPQTSSQSMFSLGLIPGYAFNSGVLLMIILAVMIIGSMPFVRRGGCFEVLSIHFKSDIPVYYTHSLIFSCVLYFQKGILLDTSFVLRILGTTHCSCPKFLEVVSHSWIHFPYRTGNDKMKRLLKYAQNINNTKNHEQFCNDFRPCVTTTGKWEGGVHQLVLAYFSHHK